MRTYKAYRDLLASPRWLKLAEAGARPQRLLWASTGTKDAAAPDTLYVEALAAPDTINTMPEKTLQAFADHGEVVAALPVDGGDAEAQASRLQREGADAFAKSWRALLAARCSSTCLGSSARTTPACPTLQCRRSVSRSAPQAIAARRSSLLSTTGMCWRSRRPSASTANGVDVMLALSDE